MSQLLSSSISMIRDNKNGLICNFLSLGVVQAITALLQLVVIPYTIQKVGIDSFGVIAVAQVVMFYLSAVTDYGFNQSATREAALFKSDREKISSLFFRVLFTKVLLCFFAFIILLTLIIAVPYLHDNSLVYITAFVFVAGQSILLTWFFQGIEKMQFIAGATLLARVIFVILVFTFIRDKNDDYIFLLSLGIGNFIAGVISVFAAFRIFRLKFVIPSRSGILQELKDGWHVTIANLALFTCQYSNVLILRIFTNDVIAGYYSIAERIYFTIRQVLGIFSQAIYPKVCQLVEQGKNQLVYFFKRVYFPFLFCVVTGCLLVCVFAPQILHFFTGSEYSNSVFFLRSLSLVALIVCIGIPGTITILALNRKKSYFSIYAAGTLLNIVCNFLLAYFFGSTGTVMAVFITELFIMAALTYESSRFWGSSGETGKEQMSL